jgi:hypothetical protein
MGPDFALWISLFALGFKFESPMFVPTRW